MIFKNKKRVLIDRLLDGRLSPDDRDLLDRMAESDPDLRELIRAHELFSREGVIPEPDEQAFADMRQRVLHQLRSGEEERSLLPVLTWTERISAFLFRPEMAVAALTLIVGFFLGRLVPSDNIENFQPRIINQIHSAAEANTRLADMKNSPYHYSNVSFREVDDRTIALSFDVSTHLDILRPKSDPLVREVIAQSLLNPNDPGAELRAISYSETVFDQKLKEALIFSMLNAPIQAVRQKAMESLIRYQNDRQISDALLQVLRKETSVHMRLEAVDYLVQNQIPPDTLINNLRRSEVAVNPAVMLRAQKYTHQF